MEWVIGALVGSSRMVALFLDDFHSLHESSILQFFKDLLPRLPGRVRVFIGSRSLPEIGLAGLMVAGRASILRATDLCFSAQESQAFFALEAGLSMAADEIDLVHQRTEGWPAGLQLFRLTLANPEVRDCLDELAVHGPRELTEYLSDNVLSMQRPEVREFLLHSSVLRRLSGPLCDAVLGRTGSLETLQQLEHDGLFLSALGVSGAWFRYLGLFAAYLRDSLAKANQSAIAVLHAKAARWHLEHGELEEAVYHAVEAGDMPLAVQAMNTWTTQLISAAELATAAHWYERLGLEEVERHLDLQIKMAWALIFLRSSAKLRPLLGSIAGRHGRIAATTDPSVVLSMAALFEDNLPGAAVLISHLPDLYHPQASGFAAFELGAAANLKAFYELGLADTETARRTLVLARSHNERADASFSMGYMLAVDAMAGMLKAQPHQVSRNFAAMAPRWNRPAVAMAFAALAATQIWAAYEMNALEEVERLAGQFGEPITRGVVPDFIAVALISVARTHLARGRIDEANATLDTMDRIAFDSGWHRLVHMVEWERVRLALLDGRSARARAMAQRIPPAEHQNQAEWLSPSELLGGQVLGAVRLALADGQWQQGLQLLQSAEALCEARPLLHIKSLILRALAMEQGGQAATALRVLMKALELAVPGACLRAFLDEGPGIQPLLARAQRASEPLGASGADERSHGFFRRVLEAAGVGAESVETDSQAQVEPLSERELHVLRLLCEGASNRDLAVHMTISENTVKYHLKNLYGKLGVSSRAQAIGAARRLLPREL